MPFMAEIFSSGSILLNIVKANLHPYQLKNKIVEKIQNKPSTSLVKSTGTSHLIALFAH
jgi:hypothetical protein